MPAMPSPAAEAPAAAAPPTPLEVRSWRKAAQRALRLALTAFKEAATRCSEANSEGQRAATALTNAVLSLVHLPALPLGVLAGVEGLQQAAADKLRVRQAAHLQELREAAALQCAALQVGMHARGAAVCGVAGAHTAHPGLLENYRYRLFIAALCAAQAMRDALSNVLACLEHPSWQAGLPVFQALALPAAAAMLEEVAGMHAAEQEVKVQLLTGFDQAVAAAAAASSGSSRSMLKQVSEEQEAQLREQLTVYITTWLARPLFEHERAEQLLQLLTDDMAGF